MGNWCFGSGRKTSEAKLVRELKPDEIINNGNLPLVVNFGPENFVIRVVVMDGVSAECMAVIEIQAEVDQMPSSVYETVNKMLNDSDLDSFLLLKAATHFRVCEKINPVNPGDSNVKFKGSMHAMVQEAVMNPGLYMVTSHKK